MILSKDYRTEFERRVRNLSLGERIVVWREDHKYELWEVTDLEWSVLPDIAYYCKPRQPARCLQSKEEFESWKTLVGPHQVLITDAHVSNLKRERSLWLRYNQSACQRVISDRLCPQCSGKGYTVLKEEKPKPQYKSFLFLDEKPKKPAAECLRLCLTCKGFG